MARPTTHLVGGAGNDILLGHDGNDVLVGGAGEDWLISNSGQDTLIGGDGNDVLMALGDPAAGPEARVEMYGGAGEDVFVIAPGIPVMSQNQDAEKIHKDVVIHDFVIGEDRIDLSRMYVMEGDIARQATIEDLCLESLVDELHASGTMEIDLGGFCTEDGKVLEGTLEVHLAGGQGTIDASSFIFDRDISPIENDSLLMLNAYLFAAL